MKTKIVYAVVSDEISLLNNSLYKLYIYHPRIYSWFNALAAQILYEKTIYSSGLHVCECNQHA